MRMLLGLILGAALTIGSAYLYDSRGGPAGTRIERPLVNWDVVSEKWEMVTARARDEWSRIAG